MTLPTTKLWLIPRVSYTSIHVWKKFIHAVNVAFDNQTNRYWTNETAGRLYLVMAGSCSFCGLKIRR